MISGTFEEVFFEQTSSFITFSDMQSNYLRANNMALNWLGFESQDSIIGKTYGDLRCKAAEEHENFIQQDKIIINNHSGKIFGLYCYSNDQWKIILAEKFILKNNKNEAIGIVSLMQDLSHSNIVDINRFIFFIGLPLKQIKLQQKGYFVGNISKEHILTERQTECIFFTLRGKTTREIAALLGLSSRTIEVYVDQIKLKWKCKTKSELIAKAVEYGYMNLLPKSLFSTIIR